MTEFKNLKIPTTGERITVENGKLKIPNRPLIPIIEGDGIGPDVTNAALTVLHAAVKKFYGGERSLETFEIYAGEKAYNLFGQWLPQETLDAIGYFYVSLKGPLTTPIGGGIRSLNVTLRQELDLYACVRPVRYYRGVPSPVREPEKMDIVVYRENTEDVYSGIEFEMGTEENRKLVEFLITELKVNAKTEKLRRDTGIGIKPISPFGSKRLIRAALQYALDHGRKSVTMMHKGNIMKYTEGAFSKWGYELAKEEFAGRVISEEQLWEAPYNGKAPEGVVVLKDRIADSMFQQILLRTDEYDVIATPNLNGDYLSDAAAAQVGGIGIAPGANMSDHIGMFEATHGTAPKYAGLDKANPASIILSGVMMLEYLGWTEAAVGIQNALEKTFLQKRVTYDLARMLGDGVPELKASQFAAAIVENL